MNIHLVMHSVLSFVLPFRNTIIELSEDENYFYSLKESTSDWITSIEEKQLYEIAKKADRIFVHGLFQEHINFISKFNKDKARIIWIYYGFDADFFVSRQLFSVETHDLLVERKLILRPIIVKGAYYYQRFKRFVKIYFSKRANNKILDKIDIFAFWFFSDFKAIFPKDKDHYKFQFFFYSLGDQSLELSQNANEDNLPDSIKSESLPVILLGYSSNPINNHIDVLNSLKRINFKGQIICPLSYGGSPNYVKRIIDFGYSNFGESFKPLTSYIPFSEYKALLLSCDIGIFNTYRQAGVGNIIQLLENGKTVYLSAKSPLYNYFNTIGCKVLSLNKLTKNNSSGLLQISTYDSRINRKIIEGIFNSANNANSIRNLLQS